MPDRRLPLRPNLDQLKHQAKDPLRAIKRGDPAAVADLQKHNPDNADPASVRPADAQLVLARIYETPSWPRLVLACKLIDAIWRDDADADADAVRDRPVLLQKRPGSDCNPNATQRGNARA